jgi:SM-20-related protein
VGYLVELPPRVIDDFFDSGTFSELNDYFIKTKWSYGWKSNASSDVYVHWHAHIAGGTRTSRNVCEDELANDLSATMIHRIWEQLRQEFLAGHKLLRVYANAHTFGLEGGIHRDNAPGENIVTTLVYAHALWPVPWGGETVFYSQDHEQIVASVLPRPGRVVIFHGGIPHAARAPSRESRALRVTLVFKSIESLSA